MSYDDTSFYGDMIVDEYDDKCNFIGTNTPMGYLAYHLLGDGFDLMSDMCSKFMNDLNILSCDASSLDKFWGISYNMPRPSLPYLYTVVKSDKGILTDYSDIWSTNTTSSIIKVTRTDSYTEFAELTSTNFSNTVSGLSENSIIEFDYYQVDGGNSSFMQIFDSNNSQIYSGGVNIGNFNGTIGNWYHFKISFKDGTMTMINETTGETLNKNYTSIPYKFNFLTSSTITAIRFKNFKIYDIVYPNIYFDDATTDTNSRYYINSGGGTSLTWNNGYLVLSLGSSSRYVRLRTNQYDVNNLIGKKVHFEAEIDASTSCYVQLLDDNTGTVYRRANGNEITKGISRLEYTIPSNCTEVIFQISAKDLSGSGGTIKFKNFKIYVMENPIYSTRLLSDEEYRIYLYLLNRRLLTREDIEIAMNAAFGLDDYEIVLSDEQFYLETSDHLNYTADETVTSNIHKNSEDTSLHFVTDYSNDETTETIESGLSTEEELVTVVNIPYNEWDKEFLEFLEQYISVKGNIKIKEYNL